MDKKDNGRIATGIPNMDKVLGGGIRKGFSVLITGASGTGKTIAAIQISDSALKQGLKCMYLCLEQRPAELINQAKQFGLWENDKKLTLVDSKEVKYQFGPGKKTITYPEKIKIVLDRTKQEKPDIVFIDSISALQLQKDEDARVLTKMLIDGLKDLGITTILIGEALDGDMPDAYTHYMVDGIIVIHYMVVGVAEHRNLYVQKMRQSKHSEEMHPIEITKKGLKIRPVEDAFKG